MDTKLTLPPKNKDHNEGLSSYLWRSLYENKVLLSFDPAERLAYEAGIYSCFMLEAEEFFKQMTYLIEGSHRFEAWDASIGEAGSCLCIDLYLDRGRVVTFATPL